MRLTVDLTAAWHALVAQGTIRNTFTDAAGRKIEAGVRLGPAGPESYAIDAHSGVSVCEPAALVRLASGMEVLYNPVGGLKPHTRPSQPGRQAEMDPAPSACPFRCQQPHDPLSILLRPSLLELACPHLRWRAFPNVAPWEPRGLLVWLPCAAETAAASLPHLPQCLAYPHLEDFLALARAGEGLATFFNSLHGGASAHHLHLQSVDCARRLAVESAARVTKGGYTFLANYPATGLVFPLDISAAALWQPIARAQAAGYPFNLIALSTGIYLFVRDPQREILEEFPGRAFGAINFAGVFITSDPEERQRVTDAAIAAAYSRLTLSDELLEKLLL